jgi:fructose-bisphosphate aldolase class II
MTAATETNSPVIVQASRGARSYSQDNYLRHLMLAAAELNPQIPIAMHQDHGNSPATCFSAIDQGFTSVMMDGSLMEDGKSPASYEYNVDVTKQVVEKAHALGVTVEAEIGCLGGIEDGHGAGLSGDEAVHVLLDAMYTKMPYNMLSRATHIHPTVAELIPSLLQGLEPLE